MADTEIKEGDKVSWNWGPSGTNPSGEAKQVKADEVKITSHRGNEIKKKGDESNPAVEVERSGNNVVKLASELEVERDGPKKTNGASEGQGKDEPKTNKDEGGKDDEKKEDEDKDDDDKDDKEEEDDKAEKKDDKAEKKDDKSKAKNDDKSSGAASKNGNKAEQSKPQEAKKRGRPAGKASASGASKGEKQKKRAATESGEPRRSKRNKN